MNAILYMASSGCPWTQQARGHGLRSRLGWRAEGLLPRDFPPSSTVQRYFYEWRDDGLRRRVNIRPATLSTPQADRRRATFALRSDMLPLKLVSCPWPLALAALLIALPVQAQTVSVMTSPGRLAQIGYYSFLKNDCSGGAKPSFKLNAPVSHGQVIVKAATLSTKRLAQCGTVKAPTLVVVYKADPMFIGSVPLSFDIVNTETGVTQHIDATVEVATERQKI